VTVDKLEYDVVDVFTSRAFAGNPLAVVHDAEGLTTAQMHAIAKEFNLSETTFPVSLTDEDRAAGGDYRVRIFTPGGEIPFAGHPTLGTAWVLRAKGRLDPGARVQMCLAGPIGVDVPTEPDAPVELSATPRDHARELSDDEVSDLLELVGLTANDVVGPAHMAGTGLSWCFLPVRPDAVARSRPAARRVVDTCVDTSGLQDPLDGVDVYAAEVADGVVRISSRVYVPGYGIPEDPATGSAAVGLGVALVKAGLAAADGQTSYEITQGVEMGRPSLLRGKVEAAGGVATRCHVAGEVRPVASGTIAVPAD
jgi:trans-2,3-dihydro-3-hydroxyanthranilate isomerase